MGKIRTRIIGLEEVEQKQKAEQKRRSHEKKSEKKKVHLAGMRGGERTVSVELKQEDLAKMEKAKKILTSFAKATEVKEEKRKKKSITIKQRGKKYQEAKKLLDKSKLYPIEEAISLLKKMKTANFDESVELHLVVDEPGLKGEVQLPHPTGKSVKVAVVNDKVLADIEAGKINFDILVTHPSYMPALAKYAKVLGPKGLMPNPKAGTISPHPEEVVKKFSQGMLRWRSEAKFPLIHQIIGKISSGEAPLAQNAKKFLQSVGATHIKNAYIKSTMSPSLKIDVDNL